MILLSALLLPSVPTQAATLVVTTTANSGAGSLRTALATANNGDVITFDTTVFAPGSTQKTILLSSPLVVSGKSLTIRGPGAAVLAIDGGCTANCGTASAVGGTQILVSDSALSISDLTLQKGSAGVGVLDGGGALHVAGDLTLARVILKDNTAGLGGLTLNGGAIYASGAITATSTWFDHNASTAVGGAFFILGSGPVTLTASSFTRNDAVLFGSAFENILGTSTITAVDTTFAGNTGAPVISVALGAVNLTNSTVADNDSGINAVAGVVTLKNTLLERNTSGGVTGALTTGNCKGLLSAFVSSGGNLQYTDSTCPSVTVAGTDPVGVATTTNNGGLVPTLAITTSSAAHAIGNATTCGAISVTGVDNTGHNVDGRGAPRSVSGACSAGAFEPGLVQTFATLSASPSSPVVGASVTFAAHVTGILGGDVPDGTTVTFAGITPPGVSTTTNGVATYSTTALMTGSYSVTAQSSASGLYAASGVSASVTVNVLGPVTLGFTSLPAPAQNSPYSQTLTATGGTAPYTYAVTAGSLPAGLTLGANDGTHNGQITGTPTTAGAYSFTITATDSASNTGSQTYTGTVKAPIAFSGTPLPVPTQGTGYNQSVAVVSGGTAPYTYAVTVGSLPPGLVLDPNSGALTGTPTMAGTYTFTITATDGAGNTASQAYTLIVKAPVTFSATTLPNPTQGAAYSQTLTASGGTAPYSYAVTAGSLPAGLTLGANDGIHNGQITGIPTTAGPYTFTVTATDSTGAVGSQIYSGTVTTPATITLNLTSLPAPAQNSPYSQTLTATGGTAPYTYAVTAGSLPAGLTLGANDGTHNGQITGTPTTAGAYSFTITATDSASNTGSQTYTGTVKAPITPGATTLPDPTQGAAYSQTLTASGGTAPYTYAVTAGALPAGLTLGANDGIHNGQITGIPTTAGPYSFTVTTTDSAGNTASQSYTLMVQPSTGQGPVTFSPLTLPIPAQGTPYSATLTASGGTAPYTYAVTNGNLPAGLTLGANDGTHNGQITGTPTTAGAYSFTITATDSASHTGSQQYTLTVPVTVLSLTLTAPEGPGSGNIDSAAIPMVPLNGSFTFTVTGHFSNGTTGPVSGVTFSVDDPSLGSVDSNGKVTGLNPGTVGVIATAPNGVKTRQTVIISVNTPTPQATGHNAATAVPSTPPAQPTRKPDGSASASPQAPAVQPTRR